MAYTEFDPPNTLARPHEIRRGATQLRAISGVLLGHGADVGAALSEVALSFSEVIASAVREQIGANSAALETAVEGTEYGYAVGSAWADDVEDFLAARAALIARWEAAEEADFGVPPVRGLSTMEPEMADWAHLNRRLDVDTARAVALRDFTAEGMLLWERFQDLVREKGRLFRDGPTEANLALLQPYLGWGAMTLWPSLGTTPVAGAADGAAAARDVLAALDGTADPAAVVDALTAVALIVRRAGYGHELTEAELDFLEAFYGVAGQRITDVPAYLAHSSFGDAVGIAETADTATGDVDSDDPPVPATDPSGGLDPVLVTALTAASANGLLVLSRPSARPDDSRDGYERLPDWVRDALDGEETYAGPPSPATSPPIVGVGSDFEALVQLGTFLEHSSVEAGTGLSHQLAIATQDLTHVGTDAAYYYQADLAADVTADADQTGRSFLNVVARNGDACLDLILDEDMPAGYDGANFFADIYSFEWSDEGQAAAGITHVLEQNNSGSPAEADHAAQGMSELVGYLTSDEETFDRLMDGVGGYGSAATSSLGQVNPLIAQELGSLMSTYFDEFGSPLEPPRDGPAPVFQATGEERLRFAVLVNSDPVAAEQLYRDVQDYSAEQLAGYPQTSAYEVGAQVGRLTALADGGMVGAELDRLDDVQRGQDFGLGMLDAAASLIPSPAAKALFEGTLTVWSHELEPGTPQIPTYALDTAESQYQIVAALAQGLIDQGLIDESVLSEAVVDPDGAVHSVYELSTPTDAATGELADAIAAAAGDDILTALLVQIDLSYRAVLGAAAPQN